MEYNEEENYYEEFCNKIPKVELHAHINGSISKDTMRKLIQLKAAKGEVREEITEHMTSIVDGNQKTLAECFDIFKVVHQVVDSAEAIYIATKDVIKEFADDGVRYLELRSTPKNIGKMTRDIYMDSVLTAIKECNSSNEFDIITKFLVSIDRRNGTTVAEETIDLAHKYQNMNDIVVGVDLSGDPMAGKSLDFTAALARAKTLGLKTAIHLAETREIQSETKALLDSRPDRIGHGTCLLVEDGGYQELVDFVTQHRIPLELCLTSNVKGQTVKGYDVHHFKKWYDMGHPCVICTDDKGVFATTLSREYHLAADAFKLDYRSLWNLSVESINFIFDSEHGKNDLKDIWREEKEKLQKIYEI